MFDLVTQPKQPFNGYSYMKFEMDINVLQIRGGSSVNSKSIGTWTAGLDSPIVVKDEEQIKNLTADTVYRIFTVVVRKYILFKYIYKINIYIINLPASPLYNAR